MDKPKGFIHWDDDRNGVKALVIGRFALPEVVVSTLVWTAFIGILGLLIWGGVTDNILLGLPAIVVLSAFFLWVTYMGIAYLVEVTIRANKKEL